MSTPLRHFPAASALAFAGVTAGIVLLVPQGAYASVLAIPCVAALYYGAALLASHLSKRSRRRLDAALEARIRDLAARNAALELELVDSSASEEKLRRTQKDLAKAQSLAKIGSWRWFVSSDELIEGSDEYARIYGVEPDEIRELMKNEIERRVHPDDRERVKAAFRQVDRTLENYQIEYRIVRRDGEVRHIREIGEVIDDGSGAPREWLGTVQDITEAKRVEEVLRAQSESLGLLHRLAVTANEAEDLEQAMQIVLDEVCRYTGWPVGHVYTLDDDESDELVSTNLWHFDDPEKYSALRTATQGTRLAHGIELAGRVVKSGHPAWTVNIPEDMSLPRSTAAKNAGLRASFAFPVMVGAKALSVLEFFSDREFEPKAQILNVVEQIGTQLGRAIERERGIEAFRSAQEELETRVEERTSELRKLNDALITEVAERKRAEFKAREREQQLARACKISRLGTAVWDETKKRYISISEEFATLAGFSVAEYFRRFGEGESAYKLIYPADRERYFAWERAYQADPKESEISHRTVTASGEVRHIREIAEPVFDQTGRLVQTRTTEQDLTDLKNTEDQLRQAQKMEAVGQLTGGIAHDFNNLLAVILGNLELIASDRGDGAESREWVRTAIAATERGAALTQRLLAFSRTQTLRPEVVYADIMVQSMLDLLRRTLGETIDIRLQRSFGLWPCEIDPSQLENLILNLAINARDAMPRGGQLTIATSNSTIGNEEGGAEEPSQHREYVRLTVSDTGSGMPAEVMDHAFDPFFTTKDVGQGSGLGLSMVYGFVKQSGGYVKIDSEVDRGTTVEVYFPRFTGDRPAAETPREREGLPHARDGVILVVEDDPDLRVLIVRMLRSLGYRVKEASSGATALEALAASRRIDLMVTDVVLPGGMSASDLVREVDQRRPNLPVLYMSGYAADTITHHGHLDRDAPFLQKPFRMLKIARAVRNALKTTRSGLDVTRPPDRPGAAASD